MFFEKNSSGVSKALAGCFESMSVSNSFVRLQGDQADNPLIEQAKSKNKLLNLSFKSKAHLFRSLFPCQIEPKHYFGIENTPDGFEKVIEIIRNDFMDYYKSQMLDQSVLSYFLKSQFGSFVSKLAENQEQLVHFIQIKRFSEALYVILTRGFFDAETKILVNLREKDNSKNRAEILTFCVSELVGTEMKRMGTLSRKFGDSSYG